MKEMGYKIKVTLGKETKIFGPGVLRILELIESTNSLRQASAEMGMSYSKAAKILKTAEEALGFPLLESKAGGFGGGGSQVTPEAKIFLQKYRAFCQILQEEAEKAYRSLFELQDDKNEDKK